MKNKKGFTLIELLSVIVLLGIVLSIVALGVSSIRKSILERQYINVKTEIEIAAEKYYNDTESTQMYVQTLLDEGYLKVDNESKNIVDPRDSENILNCYIVNIINEKGKLDDIGSNPNGCDQELNNTYAIKITDEDGNNIDGNKWYASSFNITAVSNSSETINNYTWTTEENPNVIGTDKEFNLNSLLTERGGVIEDIFYVSGVTDNNVLQSRGQKIRIDTVPPEIDKDDEGNEKIYITNSDEWVKEKTISVELSDVGSGIQSYAFDINDSCINNDSWITLDVPKNKATISKIVNQGGTYYFCAKDGAGNTIKTDKITVENVDGIPPKCSYINEPEENYWIKDNRTISFGCEDNDSGCSYIEYGGIKTECTEEKCDELHNDYTFGNSARKEVILSTIGKFTITDKAGNKTECPVTSGKNKKTDLNVYVDKEMPTIEISGVNYNNSLSVNIKIKDNYSGPKEACISESNNINLCNNWVNCSSGVCTLKLNTTISARKYYIYGKDNAGNTATNYVEVKKISSNKSGTRDYSGSFTQNLNIEGIVLDYSYSSTIGNVNCNSLGKCTVYPRENSYSCEKKESPVTTDPDYVCEERDHYADRWGDCQADDCDFYNNTGYCLFSNGEYEESGFDTEYGCSYKCGDYYEEGDAEYYCSNCSNNLGVYSRIGDLCRAMTRLSNFGNYSGEKRVTAYKNCRFIEYPAEEVCDDDEELKNGTCYYCRRGYLYRNSCVYDSTCYEYEYSYNYTYYVY